MRTLLKNLEENKECRISGYIEKIRDTKYMIFIVLRDISGFIQVSIDKGTNMELCNKVSNLLSGSIIEAVGKMQLSEYVKNGGREFIPTEINVLSSADVSPLGEDASIDTRINYRWVDLRNEKGQLMLQVQSTFVEGMREHCYKENFTEIHTPKLIKTASESGSSVFEVKYFDTKAYLAQSPQFYKQMAIAAGLERVFEVAPAFRAENSNTNRHTTEFTSFDIEFAYIDSYEDVMNFEEDLLIAGLTKVKEKYGDKIKEVFGKDVIVPTKPLN